MVSILRSGSKQQLRSQTEAKKPHLLRAISVKSQATNKKKANRERRGRGGRGGNKCIQV
jgi:hypothetical protein